jgi:hypothetical protein
MKSELNGFQLWFCWKKLICFLSLMLLTCWLASTAIPQESSTAAQRFIVRQNLLQLPNAKAAAEILKTPVALVWENKSLRSGLADLAESYGVAIWLDRRIDPSQGISLQFPVEEASATLQDLFDLIAAKLSVESGLVENVVYFGPQGCVAAVQKSAVRFHDQSMRQTNNTNVELKPFEWPELSTPSSMLADISERWKLEIEGQLPHDLLHAGQMGTCTLATQLALLASGFEMAPVWKANHTIDFAPIDVDPRWQYNYAPDTIPRSRLRQPDLSKTLREVSGSVRQRGQMVMVYGPTELHLWLLQPAAIRRSSADLERQVWSLEVKNKPLSVVVATLSKSLGLNIAWDASLSAGDRQKIVTFQVAEAGIDELLRAVAQAADLTLQRNGLDVSIQPQN